MVIDLDEVAPAAESERRPWRWSDHARPVTVAVLVLSLLVLGGSAAPLPDLRAVVARSGTAAFELTSSALFTTESPPGTDGHAVVRRYSIPDGASEWEARLPGPVGGLEIVAGASVLMAISADTSQVAMLDSNTGRLLWRLGSGDMGIVRAAGSGVLALRTAGAAPVLSGMDVRTGATAWSRAIGPDSYIDAGDPAFGPPTRIVTIDRDGQATVLSFEDGRVLASADLGAPPSAAAGTDGADSARYTATGDRLYLAQRADGVWSLTAYRLSDLRRLWQNSTAPVGRLSWCGPVVCDTTESGMNARDSRDGSIRWSVTRWRFGYYGAAVGLRGPPRLVVTDRRDDSALALLDPATGRVAAELGDSTVVGDIVLRSDATRLGRTHVQTLDDRGHIRTLGALDTVAPISCASVAGYLACATTTGPVTVWRLPT